MRRHAVPAFAVCVAVALIALLAYGIDQQGENLSIDSQIAHGHDPVAPSARDALALLGGPGRRDLADYRGEIVVMNIFASWCPDCVGEAPILEHAQQALQGRGTVLGVTYQDNPPDAAQFVTAHDITYPVIQDASGDLVSSFGTDAVPETFVIDRAGRVAAVMRSVVTAGWLARAIARAEAQPA
jgi:cytochrome c biogenesis protein CcmG/thiol:disulfide interchange protein DsbE